MLDQATEVKPLKHDRDITYAYASSRLAKHWTNHNMAWSDFLTKLSQTVRTKESLREYNKMSKSEQSDIKDVGGFVGGYLKEGRRQAGQVMNRSMLTLDLDFAAQDMTDIMEMFYDFAYAVYSTHKHRSTSPRLRLVVPLKRNVNADEYEAVGRKVADMVGMDYFDDTTYQPHRLMYWPSTSSDADFYFDYEDLPLLDPDKLLNQYNDWTDTLEWPTSSREESRTERLADKQGDPEDKPGIVGAFCRAYTIEDAIAEFIPDRYEYHSENRYTFHEGSTAGGLVLYENGKFAYSHHNTDPVSSQLVNSFDLIRIHLFGAQDAVYTDEHDVRQVHDRKLDKLEEIVEELQGQPILLFYNFKHDKERILERFKQAVVLGSDGYKDEWDKGNIEILLAHPASAGHGLNLQQGGHIIVWFGLTWSLELYQQANARLYRQGQDNTTIIHHIMTENTIDQRVYKALQNKELTQDELMNAVKARIAEYN